MRTGPDCDYNAYIFFCICGSLIATPYLHIKSLYTFHFVSVATDQIIFGVGPIFFILEAERF